MHRTICECSRLGNMEYKRRHDNVLKIVHMKLCEKYGLERKDKWFDVTFGKKGKGMDTWWWGRGAKSC